MTMGIYVICNTANGREYVGQSIDIAYRWYEHRHDLRTHQHYNPKLQRAWDKYGEHAFRFMIVEVVHDGLLLNEREKWHGDQRKPFYNIRPLGEAHHVALYGPRRATKKHYGEATALRVLDLFKEIERRGEVLLPKDIGQILGLATNTVYQILRESNVWTMDRALASRDVGRRRGHDISAMRGYPNLVHGRSVLERTNGFSAAGKKSAMKLRPLGFPNLAKARAVGQATGASQRGGETRRGKPHPTRRGMAMAAASRATILAALDDGALGELQLGTLSIRQLAVRIHMAHNAVARHLRLLQTDGLVPQDLIAHCKRGWHPDRPRTSNLGSFEGMQSTLWPEDM